MAMSVVEHALLAVQLTGNTGVNPGRPRRCDQGKRSIILYAIVACWSDEKAIARPWESEDLPT